ncbi:MAG: hypothetical protein JRJ76_02965 [Deltaproteobacteria bacterium]|nr:hypothetical protein [Deltaproteobacteria bacterium]
MNGVNMRCLVNARYERWWVLTHLDSGKTWQKMAGFKLFVWAAVAFCILGCAASSPTRPQPLNIETVLVLPFTMATQRYEIGTTVRCFECDVMVQTGTIEVGADEFMNRKLIAFFKEKTPYTAIPLWTVEGISSKNLSQGLRGSDRRLLVQMGKSLHADAVVSGTIYRFRQRVGTRISVSTPASVAFAMELIRVADGRVIWNRAFDQTQRGLHEDLFKIGTFMKRGAKWLTAQELAASGLHETMASFPLPSR